MNIGLVVTVRDEERLLRHNLLYHHYIGVEKAYVYFDGTKDNGRQSIEDLSFVEMCDSVSAEKYKKYSFLDKFTSQAGEHHTARQCLNIFDASVKAEKEGFNWLISLDADELVVTELNQLSNLKTFFKKINSEYDAVKFEVREVLQAQNYYQNVFAEETRFKAVHKQKRYSQNIFKKFYNPDTNSYEKFRFWYGHHAGKMAVRLNRGLIPYNVHRFIDKSGNKPNTELAGWLLHYHSFDAEDFIKKYKNFSTHPDTYLSGRKVENLKLLLIAIVNHYGMTVKDLELYFEKNMMFSKQEVTKLWKNRYYFFFKRKKPVIMEITSVQQVFKKMIK